MTLKPQLHLRVTARGTAATRSDRSGLSILKDSTGHLSWSTSQGNLENAPSGTGAGNGLDSEIMTSRIMQPSSGATTDIDDSNGRTRVGVLKVDSACSEGPEGTYQADGPGSNRDDDVRHKSILVYLAFNLPTPFECRRTAEGGEGIEIRSNIERRGARPREMINLIGGTES